VLWGAQADGHAAGTLAAFLRALHLIHQLAMLMVCLTVSG
jgi:hypothetical protein